MWNFPLASSINKHRKKKSNPIMKESPPRKSALRRSKTFIENNNDSWTSKHLNAYNRSKSYTKLNEDDFSDWPKDGVTPSKLRGRIRSYGVLDNCTKPRYSVVFEDESYER
ncbi:unnamed protein product [Lepeophtheirus salmonis]|uniref:(salmon louse) hypothetical protein n=1 Tax=Lepeophtheirus salmonis TaxID=72036 RepID=A0A7R8D1N5_LEPSM|nr:unnamed protein product [Lepeophtheirus salmonis]CAF2996025.1 unnamed protein product [Lepeophtheirus salmonis]